MGRLVCCSRRQAEKFDPPDSEWWAISITDPGSPPAELSPKFRGVLRTSFDDTEAGVTRRAWIIGEGEWTSTPLNVDEAKRIMSKTIETIEGYLDEAAPTEPSLLIHCEMGVSRSNAVARVIKETMGAWFGEIEFMNVDPTYPGNQLVFDLLTHATEVWIGEKQREFHESILARQG
jgi:predicted protein tyrosine phosphatase